MMLFGFDLKPIPSNESSTVQKTGPVFVISKAGRIDITNEAELRGHLQKIANERKYGKEFGELMAKLGGREKMLALRVLYSFSEMDPKISVDASKKFIEILNSSERGTAYDVSREQIAAIWSPKFMKILQSPLEKQPLDKASYTTSEKFMICVAYWYGMAEIVKASGGDKTFADRIKEAFNKGVQAGSAQSAQAAATATQQQISTATQSGKKEGELASLVKTLFALPLVGGVTGLALGTIDETMNLISEVLKAFGEKRAVERMFSRYLKSGVVNDPFLLAYVPLGAAVIANKLVTGSAIFGLGPLMQELENRYEQQSKGKGKQFSQQSIYQLFSTLDISVTSAIQKPDYVMFELIGRLNDGDLKVKIEKEGIENVLTNLNGALEFTARKFRAAYDLEDLTGDMFDLYKKYDRAGVKFSDICKVAIDLVKKERHPTRDTMERALWEQTKQIKSVLDLAGKKFKTYDKEKLVNDMVGTHERYEKFGAKFSDVCAAATICVNKGVAPGRDAMEEELLKTNKKLLTDVKMVVKSPSTELKKLQKTFDMPKRYDVARGRDQKTIEKLANHRIVLEKDKKYTDAQIREKIDARIKQVETEWAKQQEKIRVVESKK